MEAEERIRRTVLLELFDTCHVHPFLSLTIQEDTTLPMKGGTANVTNKIGPDKLRAWLDFATQQEAIWADLMDSDFVLGRHFTPIHTLEESGNTVRRRLSSELDLDHFRRSYISDHPVALPQPGTAGEIPALMRFENHAKTRYCRDSVLVTCHIGLARWLRS